LLFSKLAVRRRRGLKLLLVIDKIFARASHVSHMHLTNIGLSTNLQSICLLSSVRQIEG